MSDSYIVIWSGASRRYLSPSLQDSPAAVPDTFTPDPLPDLATWLRGDHLRAYDLPRLRLVSSLHAAPTAFTVHELAEAAKVSPTRSRSYLGEMVEAGQVRPAGTRPTGATRAQLFVWVRPEPAPLPPASGGPSGPAGGPV